MSKCSLSADCALAGVSSLTFSWSTANSVGPTRQRNGALSWRVYRDLEGEGRFVERYIVESWADYVRLRSRMTVSDRALQQRAQDLQKKDVPVRVSRFLGVG